ncbi:MAG: cupin domain-containing protein [Thermoanaerobaculia bacterium]|jgi:quercetin dioxygenase-like cupin family protein
MIAIRPRPLFVSVAVSLMLAARLFAGDLIQFTANSIVWKAGPASAPPGARSALLEGDPASDAIFTVRVDFPPGYLIPLHTHGRDERVTVISGAVFVGIGDAVDRAKETRFAAGSYYVTPTPIRHWVRTGDEGAVIQITGHGPWTVEYVNPADDPRNAGK